jgi:hypothetical protein
VKVLRASRFAPDLSSVSVIVREPDAVMPLEEIGGEEFGFLVTDIFEMDGEPSIEIATHMAEDRRLWRAEDERNMALLYYWTFAQFPLLVKGGTVISTEPAPLTEEQIRYVWNQLANLDEYNDYSFTTLTFEGVRIHHPKTGV